MTRELELQIVILRGYMEKVYDDDRVEILRRIGEGYCRYCGRDIGDSVCHCEDDS